ncbi:MAG: phenylacetate--CoA ligase family protein [Deltaproteobacteria bacterium]|nr:phenylacetate--CoA ligase family protein [Deltaproteobacteria bacterium]
MKPASARDYFDEVECWSAAELRAWQLERVREVVDYAVAHVPFYRNLWKRAGLPRRSHLRSFEDLESFPLVDKEILVRAGQDWTGAAGGSVGFSTRGTSGEPLLLWSSLEDQQYGIRGLLRAFWWMGFRPGMTALLLSPAWHKLAAAEAHAIARLGGSIAYFWGSMGADSIPRFLHTLSSVHPELISTTTPFLLSCLRYGEEQGIRLRAAFRGVRSIVAVGQPLTPQLRKFLERRLGVGQVFEKAGCQEAGIGLDDCPWHTGPHIQEDTAYLEVVDGAGRGVPPGERGRFVVTKFTAGSGSVVVRYTTGDIAAFLPGACPCGRALRRLKMYGRPESSVVVAGRAITAYDVRLAVDEDPDLVGRNVVLVRDDPNTLTAAIEGAPVGVAALEARLRQQLRLPEVEIVWLGDVRLAWTFRQVVERSELGVAQRRRA